MIAGGNHTIIYMTPPYKMRFYKLLAKLQFELHKKNRPCFRRAGFLRGK